MSKLILFLAACFLYLYLLGFLQMRGTSWFFKKWGSTNWGFMAYIALAVLLVYSG